jgi:ligand-binding SRPBCC domain-containing protein
MPLRAWFVKRIPSEHLLKVESFVPLGREEVFRFFAAAENLQQITPPELGFEIVTPLPLSIREGSLIDYRLRLFGLPFRWRTIISRWEPPVAFVDEQQSGPYRKWIHTHTFEERDGGTAVTDTVRYGLPLYPIGEIALPLIRLQLRRIFAYRSRRLEELLGNPEHRDPPGR